MVEEKEMKDIFKGNTKYFNNMLICSVDDKGTVWIVEYEQDNDDKTVIVLDKQNAKELGEHLIKVSEDKQ
jgi:hypothetical protein